MRPVILQCSVVTHPKDNSSVLFKESQNDASFGGDQIDGSLDDVCSALRDIGDQLAEDYDLNRYVCSITNRYPECLLSQINSILYVSKFGSVVKRQS